MATFADASIEPSYPSNRTWQFIWSFSMRIPSIRNWLFQSDPPPIADTVNSLLSNPLLVGYIFGDVTRPQNPYPDIGDLLCPLHTSDDEILSLHYGYDNIQPIVPMLYLISDDPLLQNPKVTVRRAAKKRISYQGIDCFFAMEFSWLQSGVLLVSTCVHPITSPNDLLDTRPPFLDYITFKAFAPATAQRLLRIQQSYQFDEQTPCKTLPSDFLDPPDDCYTYTTFEPVDSFHQAAMLQSQRNSPRARFTVEQYFQPSTNDSAKSQLAKRPRASTARNAAPSLEAGTMALWKTFTYTTAAARRNGIFDAKLYKRFGGRGVQPIELTRRMANYTFLSTTGLNTHGSIQRLCSQLGIAASSPLLDAPAQQYFEDDDVDQPQSLFTHNGQGLQLFDVTAEESHDVLDEYENANVIPFCDQTDLQILDGNNPITHAVSAPTVSVTTGVQDVSNSNVQQRSETRITKRQRSFRPTHQPSPQPSEDNVLDLLMTPPRIKSHNTAPKMLASPLYVLPSHAASSSQPQTASRSKYTVANSSGATRENDINASSTATTRLESEHLTGGMSSRLDSAGPSSSTAKDKANMGWVCDQCGMLIRGKKGNLKRHIANKHEQIRNFACDEANCGRKFQTRLNLVRHHEAVHLGRPFACAECPRTFKSEIDRTAHTLSAHAADASEKFECEVCGSCFGRRSTLNRHMTKVHKLKLDKL